MEIDLPGGGAARKRGRRLGQELAADTMLKDREEERYAEYVECCIAPHGRVYIEYKT